MVALGHLTFGEMTWSLFICLHGQDSVVDDFDEKKKAFSLYEVRDSGYIKVIDLRNVVGYLSLDTSSDKLEKVLREVSVVNNPFRPRPHPVNQNFTVIFKILRSYKKLFRTENFFLPNQPNLT